MMNRYMRKSLWLAASLALATASTLAMAEIPVNERAVATGGFGQWLLSVLFEADSIGSQPDQAGIIGSVIRPFSLVCMIVIVFVIIAKSLQHVLVVAQAKDVESSPISMTWAPIHLTVAVLLAVPMPSGYSAGQYAAIWIAEQSNLLGNLSSEAAMGESDYTVITETPLPAVRTTVQGIIDSEVCTAVINAVGDYMEQQNGARLSINPRGMSESELLEVAGPPVDTFKDGEGYSRQGVLYELTREGSAGNFVNQPTGLNSVCGSTIVEYDSYFGDYNVGEYNVNNRPDNSEMEAPSGAGGACPGGILCTGVADMLSRTPTKQKISQAFTAAHRSISQEFISLRNSPEIEAATRALTYDLELYFNSMLDPSLQGDYRLTQANEPAEVVSAAKNAVSAIDRLQSNIYSAYGTALDNLRSQSVETGDSHKDAVLRTGWPVLGLYWFQQQSFNSQVLETVNFSAQSRMNVGRLIVLIEQVTGDPEFAARIADRLSAYRRAVNREVMNTRLDANPLSYASDGSLAGNAGSRGPGGSVAASQIGENISTYIQTMVESGEDNHGALIGDGTGWGPSHLFRSMVFPFIVDSLRDDNLVTGLVNTGHNLITFAEVLYGIQLTARTYELWSDPDRKSLVTEAVDLVSNPASWVASKASNWVTSSFLGIMALEFLKDLTPLIMYLFFLGIFLAFYLPAVVMIQWIIGLVQWMIYVVEATVVIPLWAILFASDMGQKAFAPQTAQQGFIHLVSILFYPSLMVIGFTIGIKVLDIVGTFMIDYIMIGFLGMTTNYSFGLVSTMAGVTLVGIIAYQVIIRIFSGMLELNDRAIGWIGNRATFGENNTEQATRSAIVAVMSRGESMAQRSASKPSNTPGSSNGNDGGGMGAPRRRF